MSYGHQVWGPGKDYFDSYIILVTYIMSSFFGWTSRCHGCWHRTKNWASFVLDTYKYAPYSDHKDKSHAVPQVATQNGYCYNDNNKRGGGEWLPKFSCYYHDEVNGIFHVWYFYGAVLVNFWSNGELAWLSNAYVCHESQLEVCMYEPAWINIIIWP